MGAEVVRLPTGNQHKFPRVWWLIAAVCVGWWVALLVLESDTYKGRNSGLPDRSYSRPAD